MWHEEIKKKKLGVNPLHKGDKKLSVAPSEYFGKMQQAISHNSGPAFLLNAWDQINAKETSQDFSYLACKETN